MTLFCIHFKIIKLQLEKQKDGVQMILKLLVCIIAGLGAGLGTGFAGMSAAAVISPMLITFLDMNPYQAIGIALASDVLASAISSYEYKKIRISMCETDL